jgi:hypothetical protein
MEGARLLIITRPLDQHLAVFDAHFDAAHQRSLQGTLRSGNLDVAVVARNFHSLGEIDRKLSNP